MCLSIEWPDERWGKAEVIQHPMHLIFVLMPSVITISILQEVHFSAIILHKGG